ncbi:class I SAM-dependent methyltransferase [Actinoplanes regularis]|uniref:class I SAM-dependent methyltransferase n=1 Tax=Actinoplanes regularis TaxID=52697 RepID=UPI001EF32CF2|nr:methyltransferase domain-containing protein [Actinoplanes regularis]
MADARRVLDLQTGGGEVLATAGAAAAAAGAGAASPVDKLVATEGWPPNAALARERLAPLGGVVVEAAEDDPLPFEAGSFDLVVSRHPVVTDYAEVSRVLAAGATYLSQQVGANSVRELYEFMMGPQPAGSVREPASHRAAATAAGLEVVRPARRVAAHGVLRRRRGHRLPPQSHLDGSRLHGVRLCGSPARAAREDLVGRPVRRAFTTLSDRGSQACLTVHEVL